MGSPGLASPYLKEVDEITATMRTATASPTVIYLPFPKVQLDNRTRIRLKIRSKKFSLYSMGIHNFLNDANRAGFRTKLEKTADNAQNVPMKARFLNVGIGVMAMIKSAHVSATIPMSPGGNIATPVINAACWMSPLSLRYSSTNRSVHCTPWLMARALSKKGITIIRGSK